MNEDEERLGRREQPRGKGERMGVGRARRVRTATSGTSSLHRPSYQLRGPCIHDAVRCAAHCPAADSWPGLIANRRYNETVRRRRDCRHRVSVVVVVDGACGLSFATYIQGSATGDTLHQGVGTRETRTSLCMYVCMQSLALASLFNGIVQC